MDRAVALIDAIDVVECSKLRLECILAAQNQCIHEKACKDVTAATRFFKVGGSAIVCDRVSLIRADCSIGWHNPVHPIARR